MHKISIALTEIIDTNPLLKLGLYHRILNLTQLSKLLKPLIEIRTKKELQSSSALIMALSRLQLEYTKKILPIEKFSITNITVYSNLYTATYFKNQKFLQHIAKVYHDIQEQNGYITLSQGTNEITIIIDEKSVPIIKKIITSKPINATDHISALSIKFDQKHYDTPGLLYYFLQQTSLQGINIREISSTFTEIIVYVDEKDITLLFDTIHTQFNIKEKSIF